MATPQRLWKAKEPPNSATERRRRGKNRHGRQLPSAQTKSTPRLTREGGMFAKSSRKTTKSWTSASNLSDLSDSLPSSSFADSRLTSSMHAGMARQIGSELCSASFAVGERMPRRSHTSMGFSWQPSSMEEHTASHQSGFDLASYIRKHGSTRGIQVGINGRPVNFQAYLGGSEGGDDVGIGPEDEIEIGCYKSVSEGHLSNHQVPLCWEDQLKKAKVNLSIDCVC